MITLDRSSFLQTSPWTLKTHTTFFLKLSQFLILIQETDCDIDVTLNMVDKAVIRKINMQYRDKDYPTNILSFNYDTTQSTIIGELIVCPEVVSTEALEQSLDINQHYAHLLVHGILHLLGHDHEKDEEALIMEALEKKCLLALDYDAP